MMFIMHYNFRTEDVEVECPVCHERYIYKSGSGMFAWLDKHIRARHPERDKDTQ
jgi:hypothetical protein